MSRSGYSEDFDSNSLYLWRGAVNRAMSGKRGQTALRELVVALDAIPDKRLVAYFFQKDGVCSLGALAKARGVDMADLEPGEDTYENGVDRDVVGNRLNIAPSMAAEVMFMNDEAAVMVETDEERWARMRDWAVRHIDE